MRRGAVRAPRTLWERWPPVGAAAVVWSRPRRSADGGQVARRPITGREIACYSVPLSIISGQARFVSGRPVRRAEVTSTGSRSSPVDSSQTERPSAPQIPRAIGGDSARDRPTGGAAADAAARAEKRASIRHRPPRQRKKRSHKKREAFFRAGPARPPPSAADTVSGCAGRHMEIDLSITRSSDRPPRLASRSAQGRPADAGMSVINARCL